MWWSKHIYDRRWDCDCRASVTITPCLLNHLYCTCKDFNGVSENSNNIADINRKRALGHQDWIRYVIHWNITKRTHFDVEGPGPLTRYAKLRVAHAPGLPGTFSPPPRVSDPDMYHGTCMTHVPWCMLGSLTSGFLWSRWQGKRSRHSRCMHNSQFCVSG